MLYKGDEIPLLWQGNEGMRWNFGFLWQAQLATSQENAGSQDPAKAAKLLSDIAAVGQEIDLSGIKCVEADEEYLQNASKQVKHGISLPC